MKNSRLLLLPVLASIGLLVTLSGCTESSDTTETQPAAAKKPAQAQPRAAEEARAAGGNPIVTFQTTKGDITIELWPDKAPATVENFLTYVRGGFYDGTIFHRVISGFMIQGGGFTREMGEKPTGEPIRNEAAADVPNERGSIAMARTNYPHSATSQFFINHRDNPMLNYRGPANPGYAVFGKVIEGMDVVDAIAAVSTTNRAGHQNVPAEPVIVLKATVKTP